MSLDNLKSYKPKEDSLKTFIDYYYVQWSNSKSFKKSITYYPNYKNALNIYLDSKVTWNKYGRRIIERKGNSHCVFTINTKNARFVEMEGNMFKLGIIFHPLGFNHFINKPLNKLIDSSVSEMVYLKQELLELTTEVQKSTSSDNVISYLDSFFEARFVPNFDSRITLAVQSILENPSIKVSELSDRLKVNRKTLLRLFKVHLNSSIEEFKILVKFRNALDQSLKHTPTLKLSDIAYDHFFYDQSDFSKTIKNISNLTPKALFRQVEQIGTSKIIWKTN